MLLTSFRRQAIQTLFIPYSGIFLNKTCSEISRVIAKFDTWSLAVILSFNRYGVASFLGPHRFSKPRKVNRQLNPGPVRDGDEAVELRLNTKPSLKCRGEYSKFTPKQQQAIT